MGFSLLLLAASAAFATEPCPSPGPVGIDLDRVGQLATSWDYMRDQLLPSPRPSDSPSRVGTIIEESCFTGFSAARRTERMNKLERGLGIAMRQMSGCGAALGIREASDVIAVLRRTRISCGDLGPSGLGEMQTEFESTCPGSHLRTTPGMDHRYEMTLARPIDKAGNPTQGMDFERWSDDELASVLAHEAMHALAMNNRAWHNSLAGRAKSGCTNSLFYDRVYFTESACFPNVRSGQTFYADQGPYQCQDLCMAALTEVDARVAASASPAPSLRATAGTYGPPTVALPYPRDEAARVCQRVREHRGVFPLPAM